MAPSDSSVVAELKALVGKLEGRIEELEHKISGGEGSAASNKGSMRMILMGPPGAGAHISPRF